MLDIKRALGSALTTHPQDTLEEILTPWGEALDPEAVLQEYPRPQIRRDSYMNLNGYWNYAIRPSSGPLRRLTAADAPAAPDGRILVPFSPEAPLSGVRRQLKPGETLWYERTFTLEGLGEAPGGKGADNASTQAATPSSSRVMLHFQAVDHSCICFVDGVEVGRHVGGSVPFGFDITEALARGEAAATAEQPYPEHTLVVAVEDPSETGGQPRGKQRLDRGTIWYTAQSGIWQTVWLERVPQTFIGRLHLLPDPDKGVLSVTVTVGGTVGQAGTAGGQGAKPGARVPVPGPFEVTLLDDGAPVAQGRVESPCAVLHEPPFNEVSGVAATPVADVSLNVAVAAPHLWSPDDPHLYDLVIRLGDDEIASYCAFRTCTVEPDGNGVMRFCLNHEPLFLRGVLDQGYWPDGLMTPPADAALAFDIELAASLGFNMVRKHIKVESKRWYMHCDRMGMLVWQDMVNGGSDYPLTWTSRIPTLSPALARRVDDIVRTERFGMGDENAKLAWVHEAVDTVTHLRNHPSVICWVVFNEGWGQFNAQDATELLRALDPTRPFDQTSGWFDQGGGNFVSEHNYFRPLALPKGAGVLERRAAVISEFGGLACHVPEHSVLARAYGYALYERLDEFTAAFRKLIAQADALAADGLSGYVYTQLTDVEEEVNGLATYDRRLVKVEEPTCEEEV